MSALDLLELVTIDKLSQLPPTVRELWPDSLTPLEGKIYVYRQMAPDLTDTEEKDINKKRRVPHINAKGEPWIKRFVKKQT